MKTIQDQLSAIQTAAESCDVDVRIIKSMEIGQFPRQGDIYVTRVADDHPRGVALDSRQLAIGNTLGSRHVADESWNVYEGTCGTADGEELLGPCIHSDTGGAITHPEHADLHLPPGTYQVTHQMDARTRDRVAD
ncbi:MAG: hypothetical protein RL885_24945 [Planctomycetota bacterium]